MIREPLQQHEEEKTDSPHNVAAANIIQNRPITSEGEVTVRGARKTVWPWGAFGSKRSGNRLTFWPTLRGNRGSVTGGYWRIDGIGEWHADAATLTLTGTTVWMYVRVVIGGGTPEIGFANVRPSVTDGVYHYRTLCKCVSAKPSQYSMTEQYHPGGDIVQSSPIGAS